MRAHLLLLAPLTWAAEWTDFNKNGVKDIYEDSQESVDRRVEDLLSRMTTEEKTCQLATLYGYGRVLKDPLPTAAWKSQIWKDGIANIDEMHNGIGKFHETPYNKTPAATIQALNAIQRWFIAETRLGIPVDFTNEGIRGLNYVRSTNFPCNLGLAATWDRALVERIGTVVGTEAKAMGYTNIYCTIMDLSRDPRWGRVVETYGEDPFLVSEMGITMTRAAQNCGVLVTAKHFAVYSEPKGGRDGSARTDPHVAFREMEMLHLRPWERLVRETGLLGVMSSYNDYDGIPISGSHEFLIDRLRTQWGFKGYVVSDSEAVEFLQTKHHVAHTYPEAAAMFIREGGNVRTHFTSPDVFIEGLRTELASGRLSMRVVDERVRDVLRVKFKAGIFDHPYVEHPEKAQEVLHSKDHQAIALEAAQKSFVLLKNVKNTLPISPKIRSILVCGPLAKQTETSFDRYGSNGGQVISPYEGIRAKIEKSFIKLNFAEGAAVTDEHWPESELFPEAPTGKDAEMIMEAVQKAQASELVLVFVGDSNKTIGESKSRTSLDLPGYQNHLIKALVDTGRPVVVILMAGRPTTINYAQRYASAILCAWFPGEACGTAIAETLWGDNNPGGKLPITFPRSVGQLPYNFPYKPGSHAIQGRVDDPNGFGQASIEGVLYPFGFGLSYTSFSYSNLEVTPAVHVPDGVVTVSCLVTNTGARAGDEVPQLYYHDEVSSVTTYELNLIGFQRITLAPRESQRVEFKIPVRALELINVEGKRVVEPGNFSVHVGSSSTDLKLSGEFKVLGE